MEEAWDRIRSERSDLGDSPGSLHGEPVEGKGHAAENVATSLESRAEHESPSFGEYGERGTRAQYYGRERKRPSKGPISRW